MELFLTRKAKNETASIGELRIGKIFECFTLEDKDRDLTKDMPLGDLRAKKVHGKTAIPTGRYQVVLSFSNRFKRILPEVKDVPGFSGIRLHAGNSSADTDGCPLTGTWNRVDKDWISASKKAFDNLFAKLQAADKRNEEMWITVSSAYK